MQSLTKVINNLLKHPYSRCFFLMCTEHVLYNKNNNLTNKWNLHIKRNCLGTKSHELQTNWFNIFADWMLKTRIVWKYLEHFCIWNVCMLISLTGSKLLQVTKNIKHDQKTIIDVAKLHLVPKQYITKSFANDNI